MFSWLKSKTGRSTNVEQSEYEPLYPLPPPRRGMSQMLKWAMISGVLCLGVTAVLVVLIIDGTDDPVVVTSKNVSKGSSLLLTAANPMGNVSDLPVGVRAEEDPDPGRELPKVPEGVVPIDGVEQLVSESSTVSTVAPTVEDVLVEIDQGMLRGAKLKSRAGRDFLAFIGVPYAKPPLGELRFKPPVKAEPWNGTRNATVLTPECIQKDKYNADPAVVQGDEDCLYLNIYTPKNLSDLGRWRNRFPVMLYIHGGGPFGNASRYRPDYFMDEDVVLITMHYRLGALGNLNTNDTVARGNQGMKDQVMALQWIKENIKQFGGDRRKVTLFGNSYGAMEVHTHIVSPMSRRLFHGAICESGSLFYPGMINENPAKTAFELGSRVNCTASNTTELVDCLRQVPAADIMRSSYNDPFVVSIEPLSDNEDEDTVLPGHPLTLLENGDSNNVPVIFGVNSAEALLASLAILVDPNATNLINENWNNYTATTLQLDLSADDPLAITGAAKEFYFGGQNVSRETQANLTNFVSDRNYIHPVLTAANFQSENNSRRKHVFLYYFNWEVAQKYSRKMEAIYQPEEFLGASHADELQMLFPYDDFPYIPLDSVHANLSQTMVKLWVSFARDGKPSGTENEWLPIEANEKPFKLFELNSNSLKMVDPLGERMAFWDQFPLTDLYVSNDPLHPRAP